MSRLPKTCTLNWDETLEAASNSAVALKRAVRKAVKEKYKHCLARGTRPTIQVRESYTGSKYVKVTNLEWGRQLSCKELGIPKLVKEVYIHNKHLTATNKAGVKQYLKDTYKHFLAKDAQLEITPFGILTKVSNIKWGRQVATTEQ